MKDCSSKRDFLRDAISAANVRFKQQKLSMTCDKHDGPRPKLEMCMSPPPWTFSRTGEAGRPSVLPLLQQHYSSRPDS